MRAIFAYLPVVHSGTLSFLKEHEGLPIFLLDNEAGKKENPYLERDIRALSAIDIQKELESHGFKNIQILNGEGLATLPNDTEFIAPDDEILKYFLEKYAPHITVTFQNTFLRWTKQISSTEFVIPPDRTITTDEFANSVVRNLLSEAEQSPDWWRQIAAALFKDRIQVATAYNKHFPNPHALTINGDPRSNLDAGQGPGIYTSIHAEASAIAKAAKEGVVVNGCDIYVTTFPCPSCARLLVEAGVSRVFYKQGYSILDAETILKDARVEIILVQEKYI